MTGPSVLVVDDVEDQRELLRTHLERAGCEVRVCEGRADIERELHDRPVDAAILDLLMPGEDGWALMALVRELSPSAVIVIASVLDRIDYPDSDMVLPKPFTGSQVRALVVGLREVATREGRS